jgi:hypothetical protein
MTLNIDTSVSLDERTIVGEGLPSVYFDKIVINKMKPNFSKTDPDLYSNFSSDSEYLSVDLNIVLKDIYDGKNSRWFKNGFSKDVKQNLKIAIIQTTNIDAANAWMSIKSSKVLADIEDSTNKQTRVLMNGTNIQILSLYDLLGDQNENSIDKRYLEGTTSQAGYIYNFNSVVKFPLVKSTPGNQKVYLIPKTQSNLSYFGFTYYSNSSSDSQDSISKITHEKVIENQNVVSNASVFTTSDNKVWTGKVHYHDGDVEVNGQPYFGYMGGKSHRSNIQQPTLTRNIVKNSKIQDLYSLGIVENNVIFKEPVENNKEKKDSVIKNSIFSNIYLSREFDGKVDFTFSIDMNSLVRSRSLDSLNLRDSSINELMKYIKIKSLKIFRLEYQKRAVESSLEESFNPVKSLTKVNTFKMEKELQPKIRKLEIDKKYTKKFKKRIVTDQYKDLILEADNIENSLSTNDEISDQNSSIAARNNVYMRSEVVNNIIHITGTDDSIRDFNSGMYQYELEIEIEDNRSEYYSDIKMNMRQQITKLNSIIDLINKNNYDDVIDKFKNKFIEDISFNNSLTSISGDYWDEIPQLYVNSVEFFSSNEFPSNIKQNAINTMRNMLNPYSSSLSDYIKVVSMLNKLNDFISSSVFLSRKNYGQKTPFGGTPKSRASKNNNNPLFNSIKINHIFANAHVNAATKKNFGNIFFKMSADEIENNTPGIRTISYDSFVEYKNAEVEKIYSSPNADLSLSAFPNARMDLDITSYAYFTPSVVFNNKQKPDCIESVLTFDEQYVDMVLSGLSSNDNLNLSNINKNIGVNSIEKETNFLNGRLDGFFSSKYDASVVTEQNSPSIFSPKKNPSSQPATINDVGGDLKSNAVMKKESANTVSKSTNALKTLLMSKVVTKTEKPSVTSFNPQVLSTDCDEAEDVISTLPNQLKSLIVAQDPNKRSTFSPTPGIKPEIIDFINQDPFSNPKVSNTAKNLFENLVVVQYLNGYEQNENGQMSIKDDNWKILTKNIFDDARLSGKKLFCRLIPYSSPRFNIKYDETIPVIDSYFYISEEEENTIYEPIEQQQIITNTISNTFDNPQYQMSLTEPVVAVGNTTQDANSQIRTRVPQTIQRPVRTNLGGTSNIGGGNY